MQWLNLSDNVNLLSLIGAAAILILTISVASKYIRQMKEDTASGELAEHNWDGIGEYKNPVPIGWAIIFLGAIIWAIWYYLLGYPLNSYSQIGEYNQEVAAYNTKFESKWANPDHETLMGMGEGVFLVQCAPCHGITGDGMNKKAANLNMWGSEKAIYDVIMEGSKGMNYPLGEMPAGMTDGATAKAIAAYMAKEISSIKTTENEHLVQQGKDAWVTCAACHGEDGKGMDGSAPDLTTYGSNKFVVDVLERGKKGFIGSMPTFKDGRLSNIQKEAVGTYVLSLSK